MHRAVPPFFLSLICLIFLTMGGGRLASQVQQVPPSGQAFPVHRNLNTVWNAQEGMAYFFQCLSDLEAQRKDRVTVVHIGDSHIQADWFSGTVRMSLQQFFGNAGRGLVFPYRQANTNAPQDIRSSSNVTWQSRRISSGQHHSPVGISGFSLQTASPGYELSLSILPNNAGLDYSFDRVTLFTEKGEGVFSARLGESQVPLRAPQQAPAPGQHAVLRHHIVNGDNLAHLARRYHCSIEDLMRWNNLPDSRIFIGTTLIVSAPTVEMSPQMLSRSGGGEVDLELMSPLYGPYVSRVRLPYAVNTMTLSGYQATAAQHHMTLYGMVLDKQMSPGLLYHAIGANGAKVDHYLASQAFWVQLASLQPDLVIISLGTNEATLPGFRPEVFAADIAQMIARVKQASPTSSVLLTTPPDALKGRSHPNPAIVKAGVALMDLALSQGYAAWDFQHVMGGSGAIFTWQSHGLAQKDGIHLTKAGYELQGKLLYQALMEAYGRYLAYTSR